MKSAKFKNLKLRTRNKIILTVFTTLFFIFLIFHEISSYISFNLRDYLVARVKKENTLIMKEAFNANTNNSIDVDDLIKVIKNSKEEIVEVEFSLDECQKILENVVDYMNASLDEYNYVGYRLDMPLGYLTNNPLLMNMGPKIPLKIEVDDVALGNVSTTVEPFGINNALVKVFLDIYLNTAILYPFETIEEKVTFSSLLSSKIIAGVVPDFYNGAINSKSETINLPLN